MGAIGSRKSGLKPERAQTYLHDVKAMTFVSRKGKPLFRPLPRDLLEHMYAMIALTVEGSYAMCSMVLVCRDWCEVCLRLDRE